MARSSASAYTPILEGDGSGCAWLPWVWWIPESHLSLGVTDHRLQVPGLPFVVRCFSASDRSAGVKKTE